MSKFRLISIAGALSCLSAFAYGGLTDLSDSPMANSNPAQAKPNIMLLMDTSGSMGWTHMPDSLEGVNAAGTKTIGYKSPQCNSLYYNPNTYYGLPKKADTDSFAQPLFTKAPYDVFDSTNSTTTDLTKDFQAYETGTLSYPGTSDTKQPAYYYLYEGDLSKIACGDLDTGDSKNASGGGKWKRVVVSATSGINGSDERQNFANWYTFYRTRMAMVKSAASLAFDSLNDNFRVGFITVEPKKSKDAATIDETRYLAIADFNTSQREKWFAKLFGQKASGASPAREGLARVGRHFAGKTDGINAGMTGDPMQYSCQQNFTIMTTDGYWNDQTEKTGAGPVKLDGTTKVGQQDGTLTGPGGWTPRPIWDGSAQTKTVEENNENRYWWEGCRIGYNKYNKTILKSTEQINQQTRQRQTRTEVESYWTVNEYKSTNQILKRTYQELEVKTKTRKVVTQALETKKQFQATGTWVMKYTKYTQKTTQQSWNKTTTQYKGDYIRDYTVKEKTEVCTPESQVYNPATEKWEVTPASCVEGTPKTTIQSSCPATYISCTANWVYAQPVQSCTGVSNCKTIITGPTRTTSCSNSAATSGNSWVKTECTDYRPYSSVNVQPGTCSNDPANFVTCSPQTTATTKALATTCTNTPASLGNNWVETVCPGTQTGSWTTYSCIPQGISGANSGNQYMIKLDCVDQGYVDKPVASCSQASTSEYTITCSNKTISDSFVAPPCQDQNPSAGNNFQRTVCTTSEESRKAVKKCTPVPASLANGWVETTCVYNDSTFGAPSCFYSPATLANNWVETTCPTPKVTTDEPVASCLDEDASAGNQWVKTSCRKVTSGETLTDNCVQSAATAPSYTQKYCKQVNSNWTPVQACNRVSASVGNGWVETACRDNDSAWQPVATCQQLSPTSLNSWVTTDCKTIKTDSQPAASCTEEAANVGNQWTKTVCPTPIETEKTLVTGRCRAVDPVAPNYVATICEEVLGEKAYFGTTKTVTTREFSGGLEIDNRKKIEVSPETAKATMNGVCYEIPKDGTSSGNNLPTPNPQAAYLSLAAPWSTQLGPKPPTGCSGWPCTTESAVSGGSQNTLADVAQYYYVNDLRTELDNDVRAVGTGPEDDRATHQHMTTFALALGVSGTLQYRSDYSSAASGDFADLRTGAKDWPLWPDPNKTSWDSGSQTYTAKENWSDPRSIDDFWHAAVNGRGQFFSASTPTSVVTGLSGALSGIQARLAAGAAAGTSTLTPVEGDNFNFAGRYTTSKWTGELEAKTIGVTTGAFGSTTAWSAAGKLNALTGQACDNRKIYLIRDGASNNLTPFTWNTYACDAAYGQSGSAQTDLNATEQAQFGVLKAGLLSQYGLMTDGTNGTVNQKTPTEGANLVNFLRGQRQFEGFEPGVAGKYYRRREGVLGDIVSAQPVYVKKPFAQYADAGYDDFKTDNASRTPMVYVGANDGMLHAFKATVFQSDGVTVDPEGGKELWAVIPSTVLPDLYKLADNNYANAHRFYVDGTPTVADIDANAPLASETSPSNWKTILVGGLNKGGKGYYALDVTNPATPKALWEFKWGSTCGGTHEDCHLGYTYGSPIVTKLANGQWVVLVTSGYNNVNSTPTAGDGKGYLYVLNANTGALMLKLATTEGGEASPSGLAQISAFVEDAAINNMTERVYGTDLSGNVWRFQFSFTGNILSGGTAALVGTAKDANGDAQPISTKPLLTEYKGETMVLFGTGKLLGVADLDSAVASNSQTQSVYAVKDPEPFSTSTKYPDLRSKLAPLGITKSGTTRTAACTGTATECDRDAGWVLNLPDKGERVNVDMRLAYGTLVFASNVPNADACSIGGYSWLNLVNYRTGMKPSRMPDSVSTLIQDGLSVGVNISYVNDGNGQLVPVVNVTDSSGGTTAKKLVPDTPPLSGRRTSWREIIAQ